MQGAVISDLNQANYFSLAVDESTDNTDVAQMCVFVRYFDGKEFKEDLLAFIPLEGQTTADIIFTKLSERFE